MTNKNFATDVLTAIVPNYSPMSLTKRRPERPAALIPAKQKETNVTNENPNNIELIDLSLVSFDRTYQRSLKEHHRKIARDQNFDTNAVGHPVLNRRPDKSLWGIDGQQRIGALKLRGHTHWPCRVLNLKTVEEEADLFGVLNGSEGTTVHVSQGDKFRALLAAKNDHALKCVEAVKAGGMLLVPKRYPSMSADCDGWRHIDSTSFVMGFARVYGYEAVTRACRMISESWPQSWEARKYFVVGAVFRIVGEFPDLDDDRAIAKFKQVPALTVEQEAKKARSLKSSGGLQFLLSLYNKGKRNKLTTEVGVGSPGHNSKRVSDTSLHEANNAQ